MIKIYSLNELKLKFKLGNCIGARMGKLQMKVGLAMMLSKFKCELADEKLLHHQLTFESGQIALIPKENINLKLIPRQK